MEDAKYQDKKTTTVFEDSNVKIDFLYVEYYDYGRDEVVFLVENKTDKSLTIQADSIAVNGYNNNDVVMSADVMPKSITQVVARPEIDNDYAVGSIGGQLRVVDFTGSMDSYDISFEDVNVK